MNRRGFVASMAAWGCAVATRVGFAQAEGDGATALIVSYRARPEARAKFRALMQDAGVAQFEQWKRAGVFASYQVLFTSYAAGDTPDMYVVLRFARFSDLGRWQKIEETMPGGLPVAAQAMGWVESSGTADVVAESRSAATTAESQFFVLEYDVLVDMPKYVSYVKGYAVPQFDAWAKKGALASYAAYANQNPAGAAWGSFMVLEYRDLKALAVREEVKTQARVELAGSNAAWKKWSDDKTAMRKEKAGVPVRLLGR